jgi:hypothetical protein
MTEAILNDWRTTQTDNKLRAMLGFLEKLILQPDEIGKKGASILRQEGLTDRAIVDAIYICAGFSVIVRIADALGFKVPPDKVFHRAARYLLIFGYKNLSGRWRWLFRRTKIIQVVNKKEVIDDPYKDGIERLKKAVLFGQGFLDSNVRITIAEGGEIAGALGEYVKKVAHNAYMSGFTTSWSGF